MNKKPQQKSEICSLKTAVYPTVSGANLGRNVMAQTWYGVSL